MGIGKLFMNNTGMCRPAEWSSSVYHLTQHIKHLISLTGKKCCRVKKGMNKTVQQTMMHTKSFSEA